MSIFLKKRLQYQLFETLTLKGQLAGKLYIKFLSDKPRQFHVFCIGLPRSGTHSIANLFKRNFRSAHEPYAGSTIKLLLNHSHVNADDKKIVDHLLIRDQILQLEIESAHYLYSLVPQLVRLFPGSKFILTVREPKSWLESEINMNNKTKKGSVWAKLEYMRYSKFNLNRIDSYKKRDSIGKVEGVYPILNYLHYYVHHIDFVIKNVPKKRLLILDTFSLNQNISDICNFLGINNNELNLSKIHSARSKKKEISINESSEGVDINKCINEICKVYINENIPFMNKYLND